jgi:LEA14-like dessication related protein
VPTRRSLLAALAGAGCLFIGSAACSKPEPPKLVPKEAKVTAIGPTGASVLLRMEATNPNRLTLSLRSVTGKAKLDGRWELGTVTITKPVVLPPNVPTMIDVPMTLPWTDMKTLGALASTTGPVPYVVDGTVTVGGENLNVDLPFSISGTITREQVLGAALKSLPAIPGFTVPAPP